MGFAHGTLSHVNDVPVPQNNAVHLVVFMRTVNIVRPRLSPVYRKKYEKIEFGLKYT